MSISSIISQVNKKKAGYPVKNTGIKDTGEVDIWITDLETKRKMQIPWIPDSISFGSGGTKFATYNIIDLGEVLVPYGRNLRKVEWEGSLPGEGHMNLPFLRGGKHVPPKTIQSQWSIWKKNGTRLNLLITGTPINMDVYLEDYNITYKGSAGDYKYDIKFVDYSELKVTYSVVEQPKQTQRSETQSSAKTHTVKSGDNLWALAKTYYGDGTKYTKIYDANADVIEAEAKKHGKSSSSKGSVKGWWIYPGTVLKIPE